MFFEHHQFSVINDLIKHFSPWRMPRWPYESCWRRWHLTASSSIQIVEVASWEVEMLTFCVLSMSKFCPSSRHYDYLICEDLPACDVFFFFVGMVIWLMRENSSWSGNSFWCGVHLFWLVPPAAPLWPIFLDIFLSSMKKKGEIYIHKKKKKNQLIIDLYYHVDFNPLSDSRVLYSSF